VAEPGTAVVLSRARIHAAVERLAGEVLEWHAALGGRTLELVCVLEGARRLADDLMHALRARYDGLRIRSHGIKLASTAGRSLAEDCVCVEGELRADLLRGRPALIVDDLVDSGRSLQTVREMAASCSPADVKTLALIRKYADTAFRPDFVGVELGLDRARMRAEGIEDYWLFGYGLDLDGDRRDLDDIGWIERRAR